MSNNFLIDDVFFVVEQQLLVSSSNQEKKVTLTSPAAKCLMLLISSAPGVVKHEVFFREVWEERGMLVPHNTLYQNISQIRRAFKLLSMSGSKIVTVPRLGFKLVGNITKYDVMQISEEDSLNELLPNECINEKQSFPDKDYHPSRKFIAFFASIFFISIIWLAFDYRSKEINNVDMFDSYIPLAHYKQCQFFSNFDFKKDSAIFEVIKKDKNRCDIFPYIYISAPPGSATVSALSCDVDIHKVASKRKCVNFIYYGVNLK
ncbi:MULTISPECIES: winged helix-turn-helix domain-containing protein [Enterobacter]|uniref:winged helix-turn-helix domain-containing protein n=1 Tax=Enterobacter TaxID=547 RepID=UPI001BE0B071|nr:winged helix-turn-helix domain-containing protein [Enterobacter mori]MBT2102847.1 winged helix-turn-helix domain-containing protein [Enterobacter mori]UCT06393.1 winged helix-turn-helix domain-containing protein [Enterobacter mori]